ncbi:CUB domain containing protein, partial [Euroglyphus maynei]
CSTSPRVSCFPSSSSDRIVCGPCPPGYVGDGITCSAVDGDICSTNNGGCSPDATCIANTAISARFRQCRCNDGFTGSGEGSQGCQRIISSNCANNPCQHGASCISYSHHGTTDFYCLCPSDYTGRYCENQANLCQSNPCQNGGRCTNNHGVYYCECSEEYMGVNCEQNRATCGGELDAPAGVLSFPTTNSSNTYANNVTCVWVIQNGQQSTKVLNVTFTRFKMEQSPGCAFDYLEIFDGPSREYRNLGKFCGQKFLPKGGNIITSFNSIYLKFRSDPSISHEGFSLTWNTIDPLCGGLIMNRTTGIIESPGYPHHYPANRDCHWEIIADFGKRIQFIFTDLDIEPSPNCTFDYLIIRESLFRLPSSIRTLNSKADSVNIIARYCNWTATPEQSAPPPITTSGSFARVHFHSDPGIHSRGFHLVFNQIPGVCGGILTGSSGIFQSPSTAYTTTTGRTFLTYQNNIVCDWLIRVMPNERISLSFLSFSLESDSTVLRPRNRSGLCTFDYVEIYDGESFESPLRARLCGRIIPPEIISTGRFLRVKFRSDMSVALRELNGKIESPNYPAPSLLSKNCTYQINVPIDHVIEFTVEQMDIEFDHRCMFDYLMVQGQRYCGQTPPPPFYSMNNELKIYYVNDESKPSKGFRGSYRSVEIGCGGVLKQGEPMIAISAERLITSSIVNQCFWEIRANKSHLVMLKFFHTEIPNRIPQDELQQRFSIDRSTNCYDHYIMVNDSDGSLIKKFCVEQLPPPITSTGSILFVTYVLNVTQSNQEFDLVYSNSTNVTKLTTAIPTTTISSIQSALNRMMLRSFYATYHFVPVRSFCDKNIFKNVGVIRSPRYPRRYQGNRNCTWIIHVDNGLQIHLNFTEFRLEPASEVNSRCYDYLEIRNGRRPDSPLIGQFCGFGPIPDIVSHSNYLFLRFISDPSMQNKGFEVYYEAMATGCGGTMTAESGSIESPGFPDHYISNMNCEWKIRVAEGSIIVAYLVTLDMERTNADKVCEFDYLELFDNDNGNEAKKSLGKFCNHIEGSRPVIKTTGNKMFIHFVTDVSINQGGFKLNYRTDCNQTLIGRYGVIESPNYPDPHPHNLNCMWHILAPLGNNITIAFTQLVLETNVDCKFDYINISEVIRPHQYRLTDAHLLILNEPYTTKTKMTLCGNYTGSLPPMIRTGQN